MDDLLSEFLTETAESLDVVDVELVKLEQEPNNEEILANIFRLVHTIKGTCGFLGLPRLEALAHASETLMGKFRDGAPVTVDAVSLILQSLDRIKEILSELEQNEAEPEGSDDDLINELDRLSGVGVGFEEGGETSAEEDKSEPEENTGSDYQMLERELKPGEVSLEDLEKAFQEAEGPEDMEYPVSAAQENAEDEAKAAPEPEEAPKAEPEEAPKAEAEKPEAPKAEVKKETSAKDAAPKKDSIVNQTIRVNVDTLESLMTMVSELVLTRNQLMEMVRRLHNSEFKVPLQRLSNVTAELQEGVMKTRMQPIGNAWQKLPRIVRDLGNELDKKIDLIMTGADTELDRQVLELIKDPLTHMVRNSADHGLETTEGRIAAGKPEVGKVNLSAYHEGGHIIIEIADDGKGLNADRIKEKALENGLATQDEIDGMSDHAIHKFIFRAGFSTAKEVTAVSGRGVGMDVVRTNIELIGGSCDVKSIPGKGSTFYIKIPLTLAIVSALIVGVKGERFAIPQLSVVELVRARSGTDQRIETINDTPVLRLRNKLLPLVQLSELLELQDVPGLAHEEGSSTGEDLTGDNVVLEAGEEIVETEAVEPAFDADNADILQEAEQQPAENMDAEDGFIIVAQIGSQNFGIVVDSVFDTEEIVVKPMSAMLRDVSIFSGNTILGDGSVIMIIDPNGIANMVSQNSNEVAEDDDKDEVHEVGTSEEVISILLFRAGSGEPKAVPLSLVTRLEEIKGSQIEPSNGRNLIQYRGSLMPLVYIDGENQTREHSEEQPVLVFSDDDRVMGLVVDEIVDIVETPLNIEVPSDKAGTLGSAVINEVATEVIDVGHYLPQAFEDWFHRQDGDRLNLEKKVLLVDDSSFFRNMFTPVLSAGGFTVVSVDSAAEALELKEEGQKFDIIVSDIEMPEMDGFEFASALRGDKDWGETPIVALSSHTGVEAFDKAREAGFVDYVAKFDREGLVQSLKQLINPVGEAA